MRWFRKPWVKNLFWIMAALFFFLGARSWQKRDLLSADGRPAPAITLATLDGGTVDLAQAAGQPTLLFFFAPWCGVCKRNVATLNDLRAERPEQALRILAVGLGYDDRDQLEQFRQRYDVRFPVALGTAEVQRRFGVSSFPTTYLVDGQGRLADSFLGYTPLLALKWALW